MKDQLPQVSDQFSLYGVVSPDHSRADQLSPFQKKIVRGEGDRIVLQPRRTGASMAQAVIAADRALGHEQDVVISSRNVRHILDHLLTEISPSTFRFEKDPLLIDFDGQGSIKFVEAPKPGESAMDKINAGRGLTFDLMILDQPQHAHKDWFASILGPVKMTSPRSSEFLLMATGGNYHVEEKTALDDAFRSGWFEVIWADLIDMVGRGDTYCFPPGGTLEEMADDAAAQRNRALTT